LFTPRGAGVTADGLSPTFDPAPRHFRCPTVAAGPTGDLGIDLQEVDVPDTADAFRVMFGDIDP
jgi:hypothetical protein